MKRKPITVLLTVLLTMFASSTARAALTMEQAVTLALGHAPELVASRQTVEAARAKVDLARSAYWPRFSLEASYLARWPKMELSIDVPAQFAGMLKIPEMDDVHHFRAGVQGGYRVLDLTRSPRVQAGREALKAERLAASETRAMLAFRVRAVFLSALFAEDAVRLAGESLKAARDMEQRAAVRLAAGTGNRLALAHARVRVATVEARHASAKHELWRIQKVLANLTGQKRSPVLAGNLKQAAGGSSPPSALAGHPSVARLQAGAAALDASARSTSRGFWPTVTVMAKAEVEYPHVMTTEWGPLVQGGVVMSWSFFDGFERSARTRLARSRAEGLRAASDAAMQKLQRKEIQLRSRALAATADLASVKKILAQAEVQLRVAREAMAQGAATHLEVTEAAVAADRARLGIQRALLNQALVKAEVLFLSGGTRWPGGRSTATKSTGSISLANRGVKR